MIPLPWPRPCSTATTLGAAAATRFSSSSENSLRRDILRPRARSDGQLALDAGSQDARRNGARGALLQHGLQIADAFQALAVQTQEHVTEHEARLLGGAARLQPGHHQAQTL